MTLVNCFAVTKKFKSPNFIGAEPDGHRDVARYENLERLVVLWWA